MPSRKPHTWSDLPEGSKKFYTNEGVTASAYNRWFAMPQAERTELTKRAQAAGYDSGLQFTAVQTNVRAAIGQRITTRTKPSEAANKLLTGAKRKTLEGRHRRRQVTRLFHMEEWDHVQWAEFLSE